MVRNFKLPLLKLLESGNIDLCFANEDEAAELLRWLLFAFHPALLKIEFIFLYIINEELVFINYV